MMKSDDLPKKVKLKEKISIFPKGYELEKLFGMYKKKGAIHGLSYKQVRKALDTNKAKSIDNG